jgi:hypothetical protein
MTVKVVSDHEEKKNMKGSRASLDLLGSALVSCNCAVDRTSNTMRINALVVYAVTVGGGIHFLNQQKVPAAVELYTNQTAVTRSNGHIQISRIYSQND